jgi:hypothetical protein
MQAAAQNVPYAREMLFLARQVLAATNELCVLAQKGRFRRVVEKLMKREILIHQLKDLEKQFSREGKVRKINSEPDMTHERLALEADAMTINEVLQEVSKVDAEIQHHLQHEKEKLAAEMQSINTQQKLSAAYSICPGGSPHYFNFEI